MATKIIYLNNLFGKLKLILFNTKYQPADYDHTHASLIIWQTFSHKKKFYFQFIFYLQTSN